MIPITGQRIGQQMRPLREDSMRRALLDDNIYGTTLLVWAIDRLGIDEETGKPAVFVWHPATIRMEIERETGIDLPLKNFDKLMAAVAVVTTDFFFVDVGRFIILTGALCGDGFQPDVCEHVDSAEIAWAVTEALLLAPPTDDNPEPFSDEVRHYIAKVLHEDGFLKAPDILGIAIGHDRTARIHEHHDDPELIETIKTNQAAKAKEITDLIGSGLEELFEQLKALPLQEGNVKELEQRVRATLQEGRRGSHRKNV